MSIPDRTTALPRLTSRMKRLLVALATAAVVTAAPARADSPTPNLILVNVGDLFSGLVSLEYERAIASWFGLTAGLSVLTFHGLFTPPGDPAFVGINPELGARFHFVRDAPGGLWLGPSLSAGYMFARTDGGPVTNPFSWGLGAAIGYNFIFGRHFTLQLGAGGGFTAYGDRLVWSPRLRLGLGAAF